MISLWVPGAVTRFRMDICDTFVGVVNERHKHIDVRFDFTRWVVVDDALELKYYPTDGMIADTLRKALDRIKLQFFVCAVGLQLSLSADTQWPGKVIWVPGAVPDVETDSLEPCVGMRDLKWCALGSAQNFNGRWLLSMTMMRLDDWKVRICWRSGYARRCDCERFRVWTPVGDCNIISFSLWCQRGTNDTSSAFVSELLSKYIFRCFRMKRGHGCKLRAVGSFQPSLTMTASFSSSLLHIQ